MSEFTQPPKRRKKVLTIKQKLDALSRLEKGESAQKLALELDVGIQTIRDFKKQKQKLIEFTRDCVSGAAAKTRKVVKKSAFENLDACMIQWVKQKRSEGIPISGPICLEKALFFHKALGIESPFNASSGWLTRFKKRYGIREVQLKGEQLSADYSAADSFIKEFDKYRKKELSRDQIFNADETGIYWKCLPTKTFASQEEKETPGFKTSKQRVTVMCCANASGTFRLKPLVISKSKSPRSFGKNFENKIPVYYYSQSSSWMNTELFRRWFHEKFVPQVSEWLQKKGLPKKAVLLIDNAPCHPADISSCDGEIFVKFFPPNVTSLIQPMDQGVISTMKRIYRRNLLKLLLEEDENLVKFWKKLTIFDAVQLIAKAWDEIQNSTLLHAWKQLMPGVIHADDSANKNKVQASEIVELISDVDGFQNVDEENVENWMNEDKNEEGYRILSDQGIVDAIISGEQSEGEERGQSEDEHDTTSVSHETALQCVDQLLDYMGQQNSNFEFNDVISVRSVRQIIRKNATLSRRQTNITDFFQKKN